MTRGTKAPVEGSQPVRTELHGPGDASGPVDAPPTVAGPHTPKITYDEWPAIEQALDRAYPGRGWLGVDWGRGDDLAAVAVYAQDEGGKVTLVSTSIAPSSAGRTASPSATIATPDADRARDLGRQVVAFSTQRRGKSFAATQALWAEAQRADYGDVRAFRDLYLCQPAPLPWPTLQQYRALEEIAGAQRVRSGLWRAAWPNAIDRLGQLYDAGWIEADPLGRWPARLTRGGREVLALCRDRPEKLLDEGSCPRLCQSASTGSSALK